MNTTDSVFDSPETAINQHIANLSVLDDTEADLVRASPPKKKTKKEKKSSKSLSLSTASTSTTQSLILKGSQTSNHKFKTVVIDASVVLTAEGERNWYEELNHSLGVLLKNALMVDSTIAFNPRDPGAKYADWKSPKDVPSSYTEIGCFVWISSVPWRFKTHSKKRADNTTYFSFNMSSNVPLEVVCSLIAMEWGQQNGNRIKVKAVQCHDTCTPIALFFLWNDGPADTFISELTTILRTAWEVALLNKDKLVPPAIVIPDFGLRKILPQIKGAQAPAFGQSIPIQIQNARRVYHIDISSPSEKKERSFLSSGEEEFTLQRSWRQILHWRHA